MTPDLARLYTDPEYYAALCKRLRRMDFHQPRADSFWLWRYETPEELEARWAVERERARREEAARRAARSTPGRG